MLRMQASILAIVKSNGTTFYSPRTLRPLGKLQPNKLYLNHFLHNQITDRSSILCSVVKKAISNRGINSNDSDSHVEILVFRVSIVESSLRIKLIFTGN